MSYSKSASSMTKSDEDIAERERTEIRYGSLSQRLANPSPLAMGGFATTLLTVSLAMMGFRGVSTQTLFVADLCLVACVALLISAQWEMVRGNTFSYTVLSAFGLFYGGYGAIMIPALGIIDAYGGYTPEYYNAMGFFVLIWAVLNIFFLIASVSFNIVYMCIFLTVELCFALDASSYFARADGKLDISVGLQKAAGVFGFLAGLLGLYTVAHYLCDDVLPFDVPMGDTSSILKRFRTRKNRE
ncbi:GPR1/FUN34/yaaH family-domain-containing protein [Hypoxylon sp. FL1857]|nr:GPR1/FUN34/yaaH family-domain-containing protein [Hypoxylon sp. FL1857]